jgi:zinc/manganese transport system substrate-binding protein
VVASTNVWGDVVAKVAGPGVQVRSIISDPNGDPHAYEGTPADAAAIGSADLVVYNGGGYDEFVTKALDANPASRGKAIEAFTFRPDQGEENEHVWFDPTTVTAVARQVAARLGQADPSQAAALTDRANAFAGQVAQIGQRFAAIGAARPDQRGVSSEPVPFYLERAAGVSDATPEAFSEAVEEETDPPAGAVAETNDLISGRRVNVLFFNPQTESPVTQNLRAVAQTASVPVVEVTETLPPGEDYLGWLDGYRTAIATAVGAPR